MTDEHIHHEDHGNSMGFVMGIILLVVALFLFVYYLLPSIRGTGGTLGTPGGGGINFTLPGR